MEAFLVALITGLFSVAGVVISNNKSNAKIQQDIQRQLEVYQAVTDTEIKELTREVREHNNFAHRMPVVENEIKTMKETLNELKEYHK
jgi:uncharacterized membrane-anchored protein YhcB (DUF1043 family)